MVVGPPAPVDWQGFPPRTSRDDAGATSRRWSPYGAYRRSRGVDKRSSTGADVAENGGEHRAAVEAWENEGGPAI
jgi:hypothetical protein